MGNDFAILLQLVRRSITEPRAAAADIIAKDFQRPVLWMTVVLVSIVSVLLSVAVSVILPPDPLSAAMLVSPVVGAVIVACGIIVFFIATYFVGQVFGGTGTFSQSMAVVIWLQVLSIFAQAANLLTLLILPSMLGVISLVGLGILFHSMLQFVAVLHGFDTLWKSVGVFAVSLIGIAVGLSTILAMIGVTLQGVL